VRGGNSGERFQAHAWLEQGGTVIVGEQEFHDYKEIFRYSS
jgi:hypothetical protein